MRALFFTGEFVAFITTMGILAFILYPKKQSVCDIWVENEKVGNTKSSLDDIIKTILDQISKRPDDLLIRISVYKENESVVAHMMKTFFYSHDDSVTKIERELQPYFKKN